MGKLPWLWINYMIVAGILLGAVVNTNCIRPKEAVGLQAYVLDQRIAMGVLDATLWTSIFKTGFSRNIFKFEYMREL